MSPKIPIKKTPIVHITKNPIIAQKTPPSHHDFDADRTLKSHHPKTATIIKIPCISSKLETLFSGRVTTSPLRSGAIRLMPSTRPSPYFPSMKWGVKFSSIILRDMRSVITPSSPFHTSILISLSHAQPTGMRSMSRPLSSHFWPIHHPLKIASQASSTVRPWRLLIIAIPIWWLVSFSSVRICCSRAIFSSDFKSPTSS